MISRQNLLQSIHQLKVYICDEIKGFTVTYFRASIVLQYEKDICFYIYLISETLRQRYNHEMMCTISIIIVALTRCSSLLSKFKVVVFLT